MELAAGIRWAVARSRGGLSSGQPLSSVALAASRLASLPEGFAQEHVAGWSHPEADQRTRASSGGASMPSAHTTGAAQPAHLSWHATTRPSGLQQTSLYSPMASMSLFTPSRGFAAVGAVQRAGAQDEDEAEEDDTAVQQDQAAPQRPMTANEYRQHHRIKVSAADPPDPFITFEQCGFPEAIMKSIRAVGYKEPSVIQSQAWPVAMQGRDLVAVASTGSGKTAGYLLPSLLHIRMQQKDTKQGPVVLVVAPTRELARQIEEEAAKFGSHLGLRTACLYGGAARGGQVRQLMRSPHVVIGCPGRLLDFAGSGELSLGQASYLVLDEADRMLDMGFEKDLQRIAALLPIERQTLFFSATWPREVQQAANTFARNEPVHVFIGDAQDKMVAAKTIHQMVELVESPQEKLRRLTDYIASKPPNARIIVFCSTKSGCDWLQHQIRNDGGPRCAAIHGDKSQQEREFAIHNFKDGRCPVLIATDVAARGLDISGVAAVVNYDFPSEFEMYIHRIGRTGRAGAKGESLTFFTEKDYWAAPDLVQVMQDADQEVPDELIRLSRRSNRGKKPQFSRGGGRGGVGGGYGSRGGYGRDSFGRDRGGGNEHRSRDQDASFFKGNRSRDWDDDKPRHSRGEDYGRTRLDGSRWGR